MKNFALFLKGEFSMAFWSKPWTNLVIQLLIAMENCDNLLSINYRYYFYSHAAISLAQSEIFAHWAAELANVICILFLFCISI